MENMGGDPNWLLKAKARMLDRSPLPQCPQHLELGGILPLHTAFPFWHYG